MTADELWMLAALEDAVGAGAQGEVPVGAVVVCGSLIVGRGHNLTISEMDPTAHAEIIALRRAANQIGNYRLAECQMFATLEPCPMCAGALMYARLKRLVYAADDPKAGAVRSVVQVVNAPGLNHKMEVVSGVFADRSAELLQQFFRERRAGGSAL